MLNTHNLKRWVYRQRKVENQNIILEENKQENIVSKDEQNLSDISENNLENVFDSGQFFKQKCFVKLERLENEYLIIEKNNET